MKEVVLILQKDKRASLFLFPVDYVALNLQDYPQIVKVPMDLSTVKKRISTYTKIESFIDDILLIWTNCKLYNVEDSVLTFSYYYLGYLRRRGIFGKRV